MDIHTSRVSDPHSCHTDPDPGFQIFADPGFEIFSDPDLGLDIFQNLVFFNVKKVKKALWIRIKMRIRIQGLKKLGYGSGSRDTKMRIQFGFGPETLHTREIFPQTSFLVGYFNNPIVFKEKSASTYLLASFFISLVITNLYSERNSFQIKRGGRMPRLNIYFCGSMRAGRQDVDLYGILVEKLQKGNMTIKSVSILFSPSS